MLVERVERRRGKVEASQTRMVFKCSYNCEAIVDASRLRIQGSHVEYINLEEMSKLEEIGIIRALIVYRKSLIFSQEKLVVEVLLIGFCSFSAFFIP